MGTNVIQTKYSGCYFRSRLEARWAVFFDRLGIKWEYEPEGFKTAAGYYLPDFYLPNADLWVEVKGKPTDECLEKLYHAALPGGLPGPDAGMRIALLGNVPHVQLGWDCWHTALSYTPNELAPYTPPGMYSGTFRFIDTGPGVAPMHIYGIRVPDGGLGRYQHAGDSIWHFEAFIRASGALPHLSASRQVAQAYKSARSARFEYGAMSS